MSSLVNKSALKKFIIAKIAAMRPTLGFKRVSKEALDRYEMAIRTMVTNDIHTHPSVGKTFKP